MDDRFIIVDNVGLGVVNGTFGGLEEGAEISIDGSAFRISYVGGDGNDVALFAVPDVNDPPTFVKGSDQVVNFGTGQTAVIAWAANISAGPANEGGQQVSFHTVSNTNQALFSVQPTVDSQGTLRYTPAAHASGTATITLELRDNGGTADGGVNTSAAQAFTITVRPLNATGLIVTGADAGGGPHVRVFNALTLVERLSLFPYDRGFTGGVRVATGDVNGDGTLDVITAAGPGGGPHIKVFDGVTGVQLPGAIGSFFAYGLGFTGGVYVAAADVNGDDRADIITGAGAGGGPHVRVFSGLDGTELMSFFPYNIAFTGGVQVAAGFVDGDDHADIVTAAGAGGGPHVKVISGADGSELMNFFAYSVGFTGGVYVATGDVNGDGRADIITGAGATGGPHVRVVNAQNGAELHSFFAYNIGFTGGVRVAASHTNGDGMADIITAAGPSGGPHVRAFSGHDLTELNSHFAYNIGFTGGVFVAGSTNHAPSAMLRLVGNAVTTPDQLNVLTIGELTAIAAAAIERFSYAGLPAAAQERLQGIRLEISDLPGDLLGLAVRDRVLIDRNAAGQGWFVDTTPLADEEFPVPAMQIPSPAAIDLLTVVLHEFGHLLGLEHLAVDASDELMSEWLEPGVRRLPRVNLIDAWFAEA